MNWPLGIWLFSGVFKPLAWLAGLACFSLFCCVTLYKALSGAASCGCFGTVHVDPWITLFAVDLPAATVLAFLRPPGVFIALGCVWTVAIRVFRLSWRSVGRSHSHVSTIPRRALAPLMSTRALITTAAVAIIMGISTPILALNKPAQATAKYEVLEPETWVGRELPVLEYIDIAETLRTGTWLVLLYHYDCPDCGWAIPMYEQMARDLEGNEDFLRIALIAVPPSGRGPVSLDSPCTLGRLADVKQWFVTTPAVGLICGGRVLASWEAGAPDFEEVLTEMQGLAPGSQRSKISALAVSLGELHD